MKNKIKIEKLKSFVIEKIEKRQWDLEQIEYIYNARKKYELEIQDIVYFLEFLYKVSYDDAMSDGYITGLERKYLLDIKSYMFTKNLQLDKNNLIGLTKKINDIRFQIKKEDEYYSYYEKQELIKEIKKDMPSPFKIKKPSPFNNFN